MCYPKSIEIFLEPKYIGMIKEDVKLLVVEDDDAIREGLSELLTLEGFKVKETRNGKEALDVLINSEPDMVISDIMMPVMDGHTLLENYKNLPNNNNIPFLFLTAFADNTNIRKGMNLGADDYLTKPFSRKELLRAITTQYEKYSSRKELFAQQAIQEFDKLNEVYAEEREALTMEMHHRVKNNLAVVTAFFELGEMSNDPNFIHTIKDRILAMASVHENAYQNDLVCRVDTQKLINNILNSLFNTDDFMLVSQIEKFDLNVEKAIPLGLFIYETLTLLLNQKYLKSQIRICLNSYLTVEKGCLSISINADTELDITNLGNNVEGLLIESYAKQLEGTINKHYTDVGSQFFLEYPI